eukprot:TRINITY_DN7782_c0_g1_i3.p2 TRINITY_DN7782_c0_g1~~TRINITY_DN7782_c0_g1_i3.p2  ORF type:complete len:107 (+),score=4.21 TRINITY_DN7782_c0_g1_i3:31-321(+)
MVFARQRFFLNEENLRKYSLLQMKIITKMYQKIDKFSIFNKNLNISPTASSIRAGNKGAQKSFKNKLFFEFNNFQQFEQLSQMAINQGTLNRTKLF